MHVTMALQAVMKYDLLRELVERRWDDGEGTHYEGFLWKTVYEFSACLNVWCSHLSGPRRMKSLLLAPYRETHKLRIFAALDYDIRYCRQNATNCRDIV